MATTTTTTTATATTTTTTATAALATLADLSKHGGLIEVLGRLFTLHSADLWKAANATAEHVPPRLRQALGSGNEPKAHDVCYGFVQYIQTADDGSEQILWQKQVGLRCAGLYQFTLDVPRSVLDKIQEYWRANDAAVTAAGTEAAKTAVVVFVACGGKTPQESLCCNVSVLPIEQDAGERERRSLGTAVTTLVEPSFNVLWAQFTSTMATTSARKAATT